jgi:hypothetical protein
MAAATAIEEAPLADDAAPVAASPEPRAPEKKAEKKPDKKGKADKKGGKGEKKSKKADTEEEQEGGAPNIAAHPRAARAVARAKGWGGLAGFVLGGYLSLPTNTVVGAGVRALIAGIVCYVAAWGGAVFLWRRLVILELRSREQQLASAVRAAHVRRELPAPGAGPERPAARTGS